MVAGLVSDQRMISGPDTASTTKTRQQAFAVVCQVLRPRTWTLQPACYLAYRVADYVVLNLGEDVAMLAFMFC
jgi:hypothetical protein